MFLFISSYIDLTGDVQSAALLLIATGPFRPPESNDSSDEKSQIAQVQCIKRVDEIINAYLNLLNRWCLWHVRAQTELPFAKSDDKNGTKTVPQVCVLDKDSFIISTHSNKITLKFLRFI